MKNKKIWLVLGVIIILVVLYIVTRKQNTAIQPATSVSPAPIAITDQSPTVSRGDLHEVLSDNGISQWGFAATGGGICYIGSDFSLKFYDTTQNQTRTILKPEGSFNSAKVVSTSTSCLVELFASSKNSLYFYQPGSDVTKLSQSPSEPISSNLDFYSVTTTDSKLTLNSDGTVALTLPDSGQTIFQVAPVTKSKYFIIDPYSQDQYTGKLRLVDSNTEKFSLDIASPLGLFANNDAVLAVVQDGNDVNANLILNSGATKTTVPELDPSSAQATSAGFYFLTQPGGVNADRAMLNGVGFISNTGEVKNLISSADDSQKQFNFSAVSVRDKTLYVSEANTVFSIKL